MIWLQIRATREAKSFEGFLMRLWIESAVLISAATNDLATTKRCLRRSQNNKPRRDFCTLTDKHLLCGGWGGEGGISDMSQPSVEFSLSTSCKPRNCSPEHLLVGALRSSCLMTRKHVDHMPQRSTPIKKHYFIVKSLQAVYYSSDNKYRT